MTETIPCRPGFLQAATFALACFDGGERFLFWGAFDATHEGVRTFHDSAYILSVTAESRVTASAELSGRSFTFLATDGMWIGWKLDRDRRFRPELPGAAG